MQVLQVQKYNQLRYTDWLRACDKHEYHTQADLYTQPFIGTYLFYTNNGEERKTGYIAYAENRAYWGKTKREAIRAFQK